MEIFQIKEMNIEFSLSSSFLFSAKAFIPPPVLKANKRKQKKNAEKLIEIFCKLQRGSWGSAPNHN